MDLKSKFALCFLIFITVGAIYQCSKEERNDSQSSDPIEATQQNSYNTAPTTNEETSTQSSSRYSVGGDGSVNDNEACSLCEGTGVERNHSSMSNEYGRVCPQCAGRGYQSY